jgi:hypothetical protein
MDIKGVSVKSIVEFINKRYPGRYQEWFNSLPPDSQRIFNNLIKVSDWYPIKSGLTIPIRKVGDVFYAGDWKKAVWEMGRFSAEEALTGIYKLYVKLGSAGHIIDRSGRVMAAYFSNCEVRLAESSSKHLVFQIIKFDEPDEAIENNIGGWIERALEISGCKNLNVQITKSLARKDNLTEYRVSWS